MLYNGANGMAYGSIALGGVMPDLGSGLGARFFPFLARDGPGALALVHRQHGDEVLEFISCEPPSTFLRSTRSPLVPLHVLLPPAMRQGYELYETRCKDPTVRRGTR